MVGSNQDIRAAPLVGDDAHHVLQLFDGFRAGAEDVLLVMTGSVNGVVVDVHDVHALDEPLPLRALHADDVLVFEGNTVRIRAFQQLIAVSGFCGLPICQYGEAIHLAGFQLDRQLFVRKQRSHAEFGNRGEDALHTRQGDICLRFPLQLLGQGRRHLIAHGVGDDDVDLGIGRRDLRPIEFRLLRHFQNPAILPQIIRTGIRPVGAQLPQEPVDVQPFHLILDQAEAVGQLHVIALEAVRVAHMELPIIGVHAVVFLGVFLPDLVRLHCMEAGGVRLEERLHQGNLQDALVVVHHIVVPHAGAALFHGSGD